MSIPNPRFSLICWLFHRHYWFTWRNDANYRYCKRCGTWNATSKLVTYPWVETMDPRLSENNHDRSLTSNP